MPLHIINNSRRKGAFSFAPAPVSFGSASLALMAAMLLSACGGGSGGGGSTTTPGATVAALSDKALLGKQIFNDTALSVSGKQSCATCHVQANGFSANDGLPVPMGGPNMDLPGLRNTPSLMYASFTPAFYFASDGTPTGGFFRDGRAASLIDQAQLPFLNQFEMANPSAADVQQRLQARPYYAQFVQVFGSAGTADATTTLASVGAALAAYEAEGPEFRPFSSKFDAYTNGQATLTADELQGMALFNDPSKGNCTACHISTPVGGVPALFTDFTYDNVGIPRNWQIAANAENTTLPYVPANGTVLGADYRYYDMGLCGPQRTTYSSLTQLCGMFKVPTLRNVAIKQHYFHNGVFDNLSDVVSWYITRDTNPMHWYVKADGVTVDVPYNDLPTIYDANVNIVEVPYNPGVAPTLTPAEMNQIVNFLCTLTDGYDPSNPAAYRQQPQCIKAAAGGSN